MLPPLSFPPEGRVPPDRHRQYPLLPHPNQAQSAAPHQGLGEDRLTEGGKREKGKKREKKKKRREKGGKEGKKEGKEGKKGRGALV